jgi:hypothetical protein
MFVCIIVFLQIRGPSKRKHVHGCSLVRAKKLYGYHASEELFVKIYLYPLLTRFHKSNTASTNVYTSQHRLSYLFLFSVKEVAKLEYILSRCFLPNQLTAETPKLELMLWSSGPAFELYNKCLACLD